MRAAVVLLVAAAAASAEGRKSARVEAIVDRVDAAHLQATVTKLVSFGTRHTLSETTGPRGIGAARTWLAAEFAALGKLPGSRLKSYEDRFTAETGPRIPKPVELVNVGALLPGRDPTRALVMTGHYDSMPSDILDPKADAPGADDDASGTAMALELARVFAKEQPALSLYFVAVAGEEQGLVGSKHLAERLKAEGVQVVAMASVDIAGNAEGQDGIRDSGTARVFSEGVPAVEDEAQKKLREAVGGENDSPAREWARYLQRAAALYVPQLRVRVLLRRDRIARGSDHMSFARTGVPALRLTESRENYRRQHQTPRTENGVRFGDELEFFDAPYAARLCSALAAGLASLAHAPAPPREVVLGGAVSPDTRLRWKLPDDPRATAVVLYRRNAESVTWEHVSAGPRTDHLELASLVPDDWFYAVATADDEGEESLPQPPQQLGK